MNAKNKLIVALDADTLELAKSLVDSLYSEVEIFKVGIGPFTGFGMQLIEYLNARGKKIFLDLKFYDIPNTVKNAAYEAAKHGIFMLNVHCLGGQKMMEQAVIGAEEGSRVNGKEKPVLLGVTILTSMGHEEILEIGVKEGEIKEKVVNLAWLAKRAGLNGVVASAKEIRVIKKEIGKDFIVVTPGIRPEWAGEDDQKRVLTPKKAIKEGADYIVVGRPIIQAKNSAEATRRIVEEIEEALTEKE